LRDGLRAALSTPTIQFPHKGDRPVSPSNFTPYLERNIQFAATDAKDHVPEIPFIPSKQLYLITCIDPRVEPAAIVGAQLGEAIVARNVGGRVTPALIKDLLWILHLHEI
jgi:carbonic anhydrase